MTKRGQSVSQELTRLMLKDRASTIKKLKKLTMSVKIGPIEKYQPCKIKTCLRPHIILADHLNTQQRRLLTDRFGIKFDQNQGEESGDGKTTEDTTTIASDSSKVNQNANQSQKKGIPKANGRSQLDASQGSVQSRANSSSSLTEHHIQSNSNFKSALGGAKSVKLSNQKKRKGPLDELIHGKETENIGH